MDYHKDRVAKNPRGPRTERTLQVPWKAKGILLVDKMGLRFGKLLCVKPSAPRPGDSVYTHWLCKCDCGNVARIPVPRLCHGDGGSKSCGCLGHGGLGKSRNVGNRHNPLGRGLRREDRENAKKSSASEKSS